MSDRIFVDTNVLIYAHDVDATTKHAVAKSVLQELWSERSGVLSMQVLQEFYVNVTRKITRPISRASSRLIVSSYSIWCVESVPADIATAFRIEDEARIGFWDALIMASALNGLGAQEWCNPDPVGRSECGTSDRGHTNSKPLRDVITLSAVQSRPDSACRCLGPLPRESPLRSSLCNSDAISRS
jgi:predicted nucleic acid-binding protein